MRVYVILMVVFTAGLLLARLLLRPDRRQETGVGTWVAFALPVLIGFATVRADAFVLVAALLVVVTTRTRMAAVARAAILLPLLPDMSWIIAMGGMVFAAVPTSSALMLGALAAGAARGGLRGRSWGAPELLAVAFVVIFSFGDVRDYSLTSVPRSLVASCLSFALPLLVFSRQVTDRREFERIVLALSSASIILSVIAVYEAMHGWSLFDTVLQHLSNLEMSRSTRVRAGLLRAPASFYESTSFALFQVVGCLATIAMRPAFRSSLAWLGAIGLCVVGLLAAQSRGADIGLLVGGATMLLIRRRYRAALALACGGALLAAALFVASASNPRLAAFLGRDTDFRGYRDYRELLLERGLEEGMKSPLLGVSDVEIRTRLIDLTQGEHIIDFVNSYLKLFLVSGVVGLGTVLACLAFVIRRAWRRPTRLADRQLDRMRMFVAGAMIALMVTLFFTAIFERNLTWLLLLAAGAARLRDKPREAARRGAEPAPGVPRLPSLMTQPRASVG